MSRRLLLTVTEVAAELRCGRTYVFTLIARGDLPVVKLGRLTRIPAVALQDLVRRKLAGARWSTEATDRWPPQ